MNHKHADRSFVVSLLNVRNSVLVCGVTSAAIKISLRSHVT